MNVPSKLAALVLAALALAACNGSSTLAPAARQQNLTAAKKTTSPCPCLYVVSHIRCCSGGGERPALTAYAMTATGDTPPVYDIVGPDTGLQLDDGIAVDAEGDIYATNYSSISVFAPGATGDVPPIRTIGGSNTQITDATGVALDPAGNIYVSNVGFSSPDSVAVFAAGASGNVAPIRLISGASTGLDGPESVAVDSAGNVYVTNSGSVTVYAAGANGDAAPIRTISGARTGLDEPMQLAVTKRNVIVANFGFDGGADTVTAYRIHASGNAAPAWTISGSKTHLRCTTGVAVDSAGDLYVSNACKEGITLYAPGSSGNVRPIRQIRGSSTRLDFPQQIAVQ